jgi:hypothetical protein
MSRKYFWVVFAMPVYAMSQPKNKQ